MKRIWVLPVAVLMSAGCSEVSTPYPVGTPATHEQAEAFNGAWYHEDDLFLLRHIGDGRLVLAQPVWNAEEDQFELNQGEIVLGRIGQSTVLNLPKDDDSNQYLFAVVQLTEGRLMAWMPEVQAFADAIRAGTIEGSIGGVPERAGNVEVTTGKAAFDVFLAEQPLGEMFNLEEPVVLRRVPNAPG